MLGRFFKYFTFFVFQQRTRQGLLLISILGVFLSSLSLLLLQGVMNGLQRNLKDRSVAVVGKKVIFLNENKQDNLSRIFDILDTNKIIYNAEFELEGLIEKDAVFRPIVIHGVFPQSKNIKMFKDDFSSGAVVPVDLANILNLGIGEKFNFISPSYVDSFFDDLPRTMRIHMSSTVITNVPEIDSYHLWVPVSKLHNLSREVVLNRIRLYSDISNDNLINLLGNHISDDWSIKSWEQLHASLVWALNLEKVLMIFLFCTMTMLVSLSISSGMIIFVKKVKHDLTGLWILGGSRDKIFKITFLSIAGLCLFSALVGVGVGALLLILIENYSGNIMPDIFVERGIPVHLTKSAIFISSFIPFFVACLFSYFGLNDFRKDSDYLKVIRAVGR